MGILWIVWAGFVASALVAAFFAITRSFRLSRFSPATHLGCLFLDDPRLPLSETAGLAVHLALGSTVVPALYALLLPWVGGPGWGTGAALGVVHGSAVLATLPWLGARNRCVRNGRIPPPGRAGAGWGRHTAPVVITGAVLYGAVTGAVLGAARQEADANLAYSSHVVPLHVAPAGQGPLQRADGVSIQMFSVFETSMFVAKSSGNH